jgi:quercetin dioxygenase-like cupin family protein
MQQLKGGDVPEVKGRSKVIRQSGFRWQEVPLQAYKESGGNFRSVTRQTLLGEGVGEEDLSFVTRYFEVAPGGYSSLERHQHPHCVILLRGQGEVVLGAESHRIEQFDCVYVSPRTVHQFRASGKEPLGFLCIVDRVRDPPEPVIEPDC